MEIRKLFKFESAHIVRNCTSKRCSHSIHGHSVKLEVFFTSDKLDNAQMIMDFGLMKGAIKDIIDGFDHSTVVWEADRDFHCVAEEMSERFIISPVNTSAEAQSILFLKIIQLILDRTQFNNGEGNIKVSKVRYHETDTGYAEATPEDLDLIECDLESLYFSPGITREFKDPEIWDKLINSNESDKIIINPKIQRQI